MTVLRALALLLILSCAVGDAGAQGIRSRMRVRPRGTTVSEGQAVDLTLTLTQVTTRPVQVWLRAAGPLDTAGKVVTVYVSPTDAASVKVGQRARTFPVESRSSMFQARVSRVAPEGRRVRVDVTLAATGRQNTTQYLVEIITDRGEFLSVPNEALIEEGATRVVYVQREAGQYEPQTVKTGIQGELYTQVTDGVREGDQVVTFGSFFIDSEYKLKGAAQGQP